MLKDFVVNKLGFGKKVEIEENFIVAGHSYGGATALKVGDSDPRVKVVLTMDPWL